MIPGWLERWWARRTLRPGEAVALRSEDFSDPAQDARAAAKADALRRDETALVAELQASGLAVISVVDLLELRDYRAQVPILVRWLEQTPNYDLREFIVRALTVPWAKPAATEPLLRAFRDPSGSEDYRWAVGNALSEMRDATVVDDLIELSLDARYGEARQMVVTALGHTRDPRALEPLLRLLADPEVQGHAAEGLGFVRRPEAIPHLEQLRATNDREWVRKEADRSIARIRKAASVARGREPNWASALLRLWSASPARTTATTAAAGAAGPSGRRRSTGRGEAREDPACGSRAARRPRAASGPT